MDDSLLVRRFEGLRDLLGDWQRFVDWNCAARNPLRQILTFDEFHHERANASTFLEAVDVRDVRVVERREDLRFSLEAGEPIGIGGEGVWQDFQRDIAIQLRIARAIDLAHAPRTESGENFVRTDSRTNGECHDYFVGTRVFSSSNQLSVTFT
jgi:hypothetical protein